MTFSRKILVGLGAGVATGLVLGELVAPLQIVADGFVRLLQMTVLPYVTISIISSLGSLNLQQARLLGLRGGAVVLGLWAIAFAVTWLMPLAWPATRDGVVLQHHARRTAAALRFRRASTSRPIRSTRWPTTSCPPSCSSRWSSASR